MSEAMNDFLATTRTPTAPYTKFEEYAEMFKDAFILTRKGGICEIRMHSNQESAFFTNAHHNGWGRLLQYVGNDPENEVIIITGTGEDFVKEVPADLLEKMAGQEVTAESVLARQLHNYQMYLEGNALIKNLIECIQVPTIGVVNGPAGAMSALATLCDITICSDDATFAEAHFAGSLVPADGTMQAYEGNIGIKRAAYMAYMNKPVDAKTALEWGLVNEVVKKDEVNARGWEIAGQLMKTNKHVRRVTHAIFKEYYGKMVEKLPLQFGTEAFALSLVTAASVKHD